MPIDPTQNSDDAEQGTPEGFRAQLADADDTEGHLGAAVDQGTDGIMARADGDEEPEGFRAAF